MHPHKELLGLPVTEVLGVDDVAVVIQQEPGDRVDDARGLGAVDGQDVFGFHLALPRSLRVGELSVGEGLLVGHAAFSPARSFWNSA